MNVSFRDIKIEKFVLDELREFVHFWFNQFSIWCLTETITEGGDMDETGVEPVQGREELEGGGREREGGGEGERGGGDVYRW